MKNIYTVFGTCLISLIILCACDDSRNSKTTSDTQGSSPSSAGSQTIPNFASPGERTGPEVLGLQLGMNDSEVADKLQDIPGLSFSTFKRSHATVASAIAEVQISSSGNVVNEIKYMINRDNSGNLTIGDSIPWNQMPFYISKDEAADFQKRLNDLASGCNVAVSNRASETKLASADTLEAWKRATAGSNKFWMSIKNVQISDSLWYVDDNITIAVRIDPDRMIVNKIVFSSSFCEKKFNAKQMTNSQFIEEFLSAYGLSSPDAVMKSQMANSKSTSKPFDVMLGEEMVSRRIVTSNLSEVPIKIDSHEDGFRISFEGKHVELELLPRNSKSLLGK